MAQKREIYNWGSKKPLNFGTYKENGEGLSFSDSGLHINCMFYNVYFLYKYLNCP